MQNQFLKEQSISQQLTKTFSPKETVRAGKRLTTKRYVLTLCNQIRQEKPYAIGSLKRVTILCPNYVNKNNFERVRPIKDVVVEEMWGQKWVLQCKNFLTITLRYTKRLRKFIKCLKFTCQYFKHLPSIIGFYTPDMIHFHIVQLISFMDLNNDMPWQHACASFYSGIIC